LEFDYYSCTISYLWPIYLTIIWSYLLCRYSYIVHSAVSALNLYFKMDTLLFLLRCYVLLLDYEFRPDKLPWHEALHSTCQHHLLLGTPASSGTPVATLSWLLRCWSCRLWLYELKRKRIFWQQNTCYSWGFLLDFPGWIHKALQCCTFNGLAALWLLGTWQAEFFEYEIRVRQMHHVQEFLTNNSKYSKSNSLFKVPQIWITRLKKKCRDGYSVHTHT